MCPGINHNSISDYILVYLVAIHFFFSNYNQKIWMIQNIKVFFADHNHNSYSDDILVYLVAIQFFFGDHEWFNILLTISLFALFQVSVQINLSYFILVYLAAIQFFFGDYNQLFILYSTEVYLAEIQFFFGDDCSNDSVARLPLPPL